MTFLSPWSALLVAAVAVPVLLLLYLLKLRRQPLRIPSTMLWRQAFEDLQANVPFQKLRYTPLLLVQFLLLAALILAFAQPVLEGGARPSSRMILLIDVSASMQAADVQPNDPQRTRFDAAIEKARDIIDAAARSDRESRIMLVAFGESPRVISTFESNRGILLDVLSRITATDEQADLSQALRLADAFASRAESDDAPPEVVLISDGGVGQADSSAGFDMRTGRFRFVRTAPPLAAAIDNVGVTAFTARRNYEDPARVEVFARLSNAGGAPVELVATLRADGADPQPILMTIPPASESGLGERSMTATLKLPGTSVLTLAHNHRDVLESDDTAALVLPAPGRPRIAMVHPDDDADADPFIVELLRAADPSELIVMTAEQHAQRAAAMSESGNRFDLIVFDRVSPANPPWVESLTFGAAPPGVTVTEPSAQGGRSIVSWDREHPLMSYVELDPVRFAGFGGFELPAGATPLAWGPDGPVIAVLRAGSVEHVIVGFELRRSDWPLHISFAVFVQNVLDNLIGVGGAVDAISFQPGEPVTVTPLPDATELVVKGPHSRTVAVTGAGPITLPVFRLAGLYEVTGAATPMDVIAVNVLSDRETDIRPASAVRVNAELAEADSASRGTGRPLWPWLVGAAVVLAVLEWLVWCARARA